MRPRDLKGYDMNQLAGRPSVLFDAVALVLSEKGCAQLLKDGAAVDFAKNAFGHPKAIGFAATPSRCSTRPAWKPTRAFSDGSRAGETKAQPRERAVLHIRNGLLRSLVTRLGARDSRLAQSDRYGTNPLPAGYSSTAQPQL
jgi:hypothetical protein